MSTFQNKSNELNSYLLHLEAHEKTKRKWKSRIFIGVGALVCLVAISTLSFFSLQTKGEIANEELLSPDEIFVELPILDDSLDNELFSLSSEPEEMDLETYVSDISDLDLGLFIEGSKMVGEQLNLVILGFDESFTYEVDMGTGSREKITEPVFPFSYQKNGTYELSLLVSNQQAERRAFKRSIRISSKEKVEVESKEERKVQADKEINPSPLISAISPEEPLVEKRELVEALPPVSIPSALEEKELPSPPNTEILGNASKEVSPSSATSPSEAAESGNTPFTFRVKEKLPEFKGGKKQLKRYLSKNISYPDEAIQNQIEGNVIVRFTVEPDGSISSPTIVKSLGYGCDEEALRLVTNMPFWSPGMQGDRAVRAYSLVSIMFSMW